jgi:hypothetical protein
MPTIKSGEFRTLGQALLPKTETLVSINEREREMIDFNNELRAHRIVTLIFAALAGISAISTAVAPAIL